MYLVCEIIVEMSLNDHFVLGALVVLYVLYSLLILLVFYLLYVVVAILDVLLEGSVHDDPSHCLRGL